MNSHGQWRWHRQKRRVLLQGLLWRQLESNRGDRRRRSPSIPRGGKIQLDDEPLRREVGRFRRSRLIILLHWSRRISGSRNRTTGKTSSHEGARSSPRQPNPLSPSMIPIESTPSGRVATPRDWQMRPGVRGARGGDTGIWGDDQRRARRGWNAGSSIRRGATAGGGVRPRGPSSDAGEFRLKGGEARKQQLSPSPPPPPHFKSNSII